MSYDVSATRGDVSTPAAIEMRCQQINERATLVREFEWFTDDHLRQGEPAQRGPEEVADRLASPSSTERIKRTSEAGQLVRQVGKVLFEPWFAAGSRGDEDLERCERSGIAECVPAGVDNGLYTLSRRTDREFDVVDRFT
ncbi:MAG: hypothetical protein ABSG39_10550 [Acidimicrobiales bacterium]